LFFTAQEQLREVEASAIGFRGDRMSQFSGRFCVSAELSECMPKPHAGVSILRRKRKTLAKKLFGTLELREARTDRRADATGAQLTDGCLYGW
jgi:hypothetical protein